MSDIPVFGTFDSVIASNGLESESVPVHERQRSWSRPVKKTIYTLNIGNYAPEICALTYPLIRAYANKIGADFHIIKDRKFPGWPVVYEKLQIHELGRTHGNDWNYCVDGDTLINPDMFDVTEHIQKNTICHNGRDMAGIRWKYDQYFRRDGRHIGSCNWFTVGSDWCLDLWRPLDDLTMQEALENINITVAERNSRLCSTEHLIDDYTLSRNIARFGLKVQTITDVCGQFGWRGQQGQGTSPFLYHAYTISNEQKARDMLALLTTPCSQAGPNGPGWGLMTQAAAAEYRQKFGLSQSKGTVTTVGRPESVAAPGSHIQGWMAPEELTWLHETAKGMASVVEVGSWKGRSTFALCSSGCARVIAVDHFLGSSEHQEEFGFAYGWSPLPEFQKNILDKFSNVELRQMASAEAAKEFPDGGVDMVFIDGAHEYEPVLDDIAAWEPKAGRLIAFHCQSYPGIRRALTEYFQRPPDQMAGDIAIFRK